MKLKIMNKERKKKEYPISIAWQDHTFGMNRLYFETIFDEKGKGQFISTDDLLCWMIEY